MKYRGPIVFLLLSVVFPFFAYASCDSQGYTVVYVNGIATTRNQANEQSALLKRKFEQESTIVNVDFQTAYNPTHLVTMSDWIDSIKQSYGRSGADYTNDVDFATILHDIAGRVTTRKVLLLGHSQGTFYTNELYAYLVSHGVPTSSIAVYNIATPASFVAGGGRYLTSSHDGTINAVRSLASLGKAPAPLPANITLTLSDVEKGIVGSGHSFQDDYLAQAPERIIADMEQGLNSLSADTYAADTPTCFVAKNDSLNVTIQRFLFAVADPMATIAYYDVVPVLVATNAPLYYTYTVGSALMHTILNGIQPASQTSAVAVASENIPAYGDDAQYGVSNGGDSNGVPDNVTYHTPDGYADPVRSSVHIAPQTATSSAPDASSSIVAIQSIQPYQPGFGGGGGVYIQPASSDDGNVTENEITQESETASTTDDTASTTPQTTPDTTFTTTATTTDTTTTEDTHHSEEEEATSTCLMSLSTDACLITTPSRRNPDAVVVPHPLLINEIGWAGINRGHVPLAQYIEIKNTTAYTIDMSHVSIARSAGDPIPLSGTIEPHGFLVVSNDEIGYQLLHSASLALTFPALATSASEQLSLVWDEGTAHFTLDVTPPPDACSGMWCAGTWDTEYGKDLYQVANLGTPFSMERSDATEARGDDPASWHTADVYGSWITPDTNPYRWGSPGAENTKGIPTFAVQCDGGPIITETPDTDTPPVMKIHSGSSCITYGAFVSPGAWHSGALFRGVPGHATKVQDIFVPKYDQSIYRSAISRDTFTLPDDVVAGEPFFIAVWDSAGPWSWFDLDFVTAFSDANSGVKPHIDIYKIARWTNGVASGTDVVE